MRATPAEARHPPWVVSWRGWGLQVALRCARLGNESSKIMMEENRKTTTSHMKTTPATGRHLHWAVLWKG